MIIGVGTDIVEVSRMHDVVERHGDRFLERVFTDEELPDVPDAARKPPNHRRRRNATDAYIDVE